MNERIQKLAEQCYHRYSQYNIDLEKFAELIIDHATKCVRDVRDENSDLSYDTAAQVQNRIKQHFGVEE